jgi:hypothetical protein
VPTRNVVIELGAAVVRIAVMIVEPADGSRWDRLNRRPER